MSNIEIIASVVAMVSVTAIAWLYSQQRHRHRLSDHHRDWIADTLATISDESNRKREHTNAVPRNDMPATFTQLMSLLEHQSGDVISDAEEMQRLWVEMDTLLDEFGGDLPSDESKLTILKARVQKLADRIDELANEIQQGLE